MREAPYLSTEQIEDIIESELRKARMMPTASNPVLDLDEFIATHLKCGFDPYAELPSDVMGEVCFPPEKRPKISINRDLSTEADTGQSISTIGRQRATTAHEASHVILHKGLFLPSPGQGTLFSTSDEAPADGLTVHRCFKSSLGQLSAGLWHNSPGEYLSRNIQHIEIQANKGMSAMLLPRSVFMPLMMPLIETLRVNTSPQIINAQRESLVSHISERFQVSRQFALIRIRTMKLESIIGQEKMILLFDS